MKRHRELFVLAALGLAILMAGCWGSSKSTSLEVGTAPQPARVGFQQCINTCHATTPDHITGLPIATTWANAIHYLDGKVECEDCHGGGGNHWGVGPIPEPNPTNTCAACHGFPGFIATRHYDQKSMPGALFFQPDAGTGQAELFGIPVLRADNVTPVTRAQHIEECSRCHNPSQQFLYAKDGTLDKPDPAAMPVPHVSCGGCHDGHNPMTDTNLVTQRGGADVPYPRFRNYLVDVNTGAQTDNVSAQVGLATLNLIFQPNGAVYGLVAPNYALVVNNNNEIYLERVCAACHAAGKYKYTVFNANGDDVSTTHQPDMYTQWTKSGHGDRAGAPWGEFSANPTFYDPTFALTHRTTYPYDMALSAAGATATTLQNAGNNNFACFKCHHGLGSIAYQDNVEGTPAAPVLFGDEPATCATCHNPHTNVAGQDSNTRKPVVFTKYASAQVNLSGNVFLDGTPVPPETGNATVCAFCHQGRESGLTLFKRKLDNGVVITGNFLNPHYLGTGAMLWARNGYEFGGKQYGMVTAHQQTNCFGCHMADGQNPDGTPNDDIGDHTWKIVSDDDSVVNSATCNQASCHNGRIPTTNSAGQFDSVSDTVLVPARDYDQNGVAEGIPVEIAGLENLVISLLDNNGIEYHDDAYPYFFVKGTFVPGPPASGTSFTAWTRPIYKAAFNLSFVIKGLPSGGSQIGKPNTSAAVHNYRYNIQLLMDSYENLYNNTPGVNPALPAPNALLANRPTGSRPATNYANPGSAAYSPLQ